MPYIYKPTYIYQWFFRFVKCLLVYLLIYVGVMCSKCIVAIDKIIVQISIVLVALPISINSYCAFILSIIQ